MPFLQVVTAHARTHTHTHTHQSRLVSIRWDGLFSFFRRFCYGWLFVVHSLVRRSVVDTLEREEERDFILIYFTPYIRPSIALRMAALPDLEIVVCKRRALT